ncbi:MAG: DUF3566 domain-containing protein [Candidatus Eremiobacteraeota bacterium]|nr:DUF3566 domain-containing protein [Candidatus Eremiobacteraeota bacterium]MBV9408165.1 DUF3566 domain-containing protein [Candidatus Eremiobacteraeota bacterium]
MRVRVTNVNPVQYAIVYATLLAFVGLIGGVIFGLASTVMPSTGGPFPNFGWLAIIIFPIMYAVIGFIAGLIGSLIYNLIANWTGGIEVTLTQVGSPVSTTTVVTTP